jgi:hypothetical protein
MRMMIQQSVSKFGCFEHFLFSFFRQKHSLYDRNLPAVRRKLKEHREEINDIHKFIEQRDKQMGKEMELLLSTVMDRCSSQINGK